MKKTLILSLALLGFAAGSNAQLLACDFQPVLSRAGVMEGQKSSQVSIQAHASFRTTNLGPLGCRSEDGRSPLQSESAFLADDWNSNYRFDLLYPKHSTVIF